MANPLQFLRSITSTPTGLTKPKQSSLEAIGKAKSLPNKESTPEHETVEPVIKCELKKLCITTKLPKNVAILHIFPDEQNRYSVKGGQAEQPMDDLVEREEKPNISFIKEEGEKQITRAKKIKKLMCEFSDLNYPIIKWIERLRNKFDEKLYLVIVDYTNFEIPWEMLELSPKEYIGALITTVRWRKVNDKNSDEPHLILKLQDDECCGKTVAYFLDTELKLEPEMQAFGKLEATLFKSTKCRINDFHDHLHSGDTSDHSFVYIACHGVFGDHPDKIVLGSETKTEMQLKLQDLRDRPLNPKRQSQGVVFINACHSAREVTHPDLKHSYRKNFIELFLRQGAQGVIGTLGAVVDRVATQFACDLIEKSLQPSPPPIAKILKELRSKAVENYKNQPEDPKNLISLINAFMYVYYGNPKTVVRLTRRGE